MHELSICRSISGIVERHAAGRRVRTIHVRVGALRQIVPDTLVYCWSLVSEDTPLAGSEMRVEGVPAMVHCIPCDHSRTISEPFMTCDRCGGSDVRVVAGEEFLITSLDLAEV
ncbi:MAG: hydrogenase expression protein HupH [Pseudonocardia sp. SCN 72-86]|nr:MAG: hydrogenase expression protein HupH [Pseudonocardia sp. SCN 72-86]